MNRNKRKSPQDQKLQNQKPQGQRSPEKKPKLSAEEYEKRKIDMAKERNARVMRINSAVTGDMHNSLKQLDIALQNLKMRLGEPGGVPFEKGIAILEEGKKLAILVSRFTAKVSRIVGFNYYEPRGIQEFIKEGYGAGEEKPFEKTGSRRGGVIRMEKAG